MKLFVFLFSVLAAFGQAPAGIKINEHLRPSSETVAMFWSTMPTTTPATTKPATGRSAQSIVPAPGVVEVARLDNYVSARFSLDFVRLAGNEVCLAFEYDFDGQSLRGSPMCFSVPPPTPSAGGASSTSAMWWDFFQGTPVQLGYGGNTTFRVCAKWAGNAGCTSAILPSWQGGQIGYNFTATATTTEKNRVVISGLGWLVGKSSVTVSVNSEILPVTTDQLGNITVEPSSLRQENRVTVCIDGACTYRIAYTFYPGKG